MGEVLNPTAAGEKPFATGQENALFRPFPGYGGD
jgi:hypothetical protein